MSDATPLTFDVDVRDAAGAVVDLVIEEFNWEDRSPRFAQIRMNFL